MKTSEELHATADLLQVRGWTQATDDAGSNWYPRPDDTNPVCIEGALRLVRDGRKFGAAYDALKSFLTDTYPECINPETGYVIPFSWNDRPGRTFDEVISVLRATAELEAARESQSVEAIAS